ncbi:MAG: hypothetical protein ABI112_04865 [Terracoccus sp.]
MTQPDRHDGHANERMRGHAVVAAPDGSSLLETLTGGALLCEQERHTGEDDRRGTAETACGLVEYADIISVHGPVDAAPDDLVRSISRPRSRDLHRDQPAPPQHLPGRRDGRNPPARGE